MTNLRYGDLIIIMFVIIVIIVIIVFFAQLHFALGIFT